MSENMDKHMDKTSIKADMLKQVGTEVGVTDWVLIDQQRIQDFADATLDQQWIHTDPDKAAKGPFGGPIAHGLLTLSLLPHFGEQVAWVPRPAMSVNYGYNKVRFTAPLPSGSRIRSRLTLESVEDRSDGGFTLIITHRIEREGDLLADGGRPIVVAESVGLIYY